MNSGYQYSPYIWPGLASAVFLGALGVYAWRHRATPGAIPFAALMLFTTLAALSSAGEAAGADLPTKVFWFKAEALMRLPASLAALWFALEYAGLSAWSTRRNLALLAIPAVALVPIAFVNGLDRIAYSRYWLDGTVRAEFAAVGLAASAYGMILTLLAMAIFVMVFVRSPQHRRPVALILLGQLVLRLGYSLENLLPVYAASLDLTVLTFDFTCLMYAIGLFRFRLFDVVPVARASVVERIADAVVVLDAAGLIADLNPAARELFGAERSRLLGRDGAEVLKPFLALAELARDPAPRQIEICLEVPPGQRWYQVSISPLTDQRGFYLGSLIVLHDITPLKQAHERILQTERALAALHERERLARELHDSVGQVLAYVSLQADAARRLLDDGKTTLATTQMARLASIARDAHADVREFILDLRAAPAEQRAFFPALRRYLEGFTQNYGIVTALVPPDGLGDAAFEPEVQAQLFRIIQEALSNARRHGDARSVKVTFEGQDNLARVIVQDDGDGFDPRAVEGGFGLRSMRERAAEMGGSVEVQSAPGEGTKVVVGLPLRQLQEA